MCTHRQTQYIINSLQLPILILLAVSASHNIITFSSTSLARNASHISGEETTQSRFSESVCAYLKMTGRQLDKADKTVPCHNYFCNCDLTYFRTFVCYDMLNIYFFQQLIGIIIIILLLLLLLLLLLYYFSVS
jgi:hypothetical protein